MMMHPSFSAGPLRLQEAAQLRLSNPTRANEFMLIVLHCSSFVRPAGLVA